jgi:Flp pilus assembly protein TadG
MPLLIILLFGFVEFGRALLQINTLTKAVTARYVARVPDAVTAPTACDAGTAWTAAIAQAELLIKNSDAGTGDLILPGLDGEGAITFSEPRPYTDEGLGIEACVVTVVATVPFAAMSGDSLVPFFQVGPITLRAQAEERYLGE